MKPGLMPDDVSANTIRDWCTRDGDLRDYFLIGYRQGLVDRAAGAIKPDLLLSGLVIPAGRGA
jgi:hypothetical protein